MYVVFLENNNPNAALIEYLSFYFPKKNLIQISENCAVGIKQWLVVSSIKILENVLENKHNDNVVMVVFNPVNIDKFNEEIIDHINYDCNAVIFDNLDYKCDKNWMIGSLQAVSKILLSADKILDNNLLKTNVQYFSLSHGKYQELVWYAHRIGLKVFNA